MKKALGKIFRILLMLVIFVIVLVLSINLPIAVFSNQTTTSGYDNWMSNTLDDNQKIINIAMLGAHDAFTSDMTFFSTVDEESADSLMTGVTGVLIKGYIYRQSKTQTSSVTELLEAGVRYFDIRLTYNENKGMWMTVHNYFSSPFEDVLSEINTFLESHPGEFLILDIQHVNGIDYSDLTSFNEIRTLFSDSGVLNYAIEEESGVALSDITYGDITSNGTEAGVIILTKYEDADPAFFSYQSSIRSNWANTDDSFTLFQFLDDEAELIQNHEAYTGNQVSDNNDAIDSLEGFRVMQGVLTMQLSVDGIMNSLVDWSLLQRAERVNTELIENVDFETWLASMPIVMVDYATTSKDDFLNLVMEKIIDFNEN